MSEQELWNEIEVDADAFDKLTTENGSELSGLIRTTTSIQKDLKAAEGAVKRLKVERDRYLFDLIPAKMAETGMTKVEVEGNQVTLQQFGAEDFIKNEISVRFGLNEDNKVKAVQADLDERGFDTATRTWVEPMTLKKLLRERVEAGQEIDLEMFNGYVGTIAKIKGV